jgi:peptide/nickel transport system substrate-binding protein
VRRLARRQVVGGLAATGALALACTPPSWPGPAPTGTPARPRRGPPGTVTLGLSVEPTTLAAPPGGEGWGGQPYAARLAANLTMCQLVGIDALGQPYPDLAESVPTLEAGGARLLGEGDQRQLQTTFRLRRAARWSDGQPLTARDVVFTWELLLNPLFAPTVATAHRYERVEAPDDATVVFSGFSERSARAAAGRDPNRYGFLAGQRGPVLDPLYLFGLPHSWVYPAHVLGRLVDGDPRRSPRAADLLTASPYARAPVGGGPFALQDWQPGRRLAFAARADYHRGPPRLRAVHLSIAPPDQLAGALALGELDLLTAEALGGAPPTPPGAVLASRPGAAVEGIDLNLDHPALRDRALREALLRALDRPGLAALVGLAPAAPPAPAASPGPAAATSPGPAVATSPAPATASDAAAARYPRDLARAADLLVAAGWPPGSDGARSRGGRRLALRLLTTDDQPRRRLAEALRDAFAGVGVGVDVEARPLAELADRLRRRDFDLALYAQLDGLDRLADLGERYAAAAIPSAANPWGGDNYPGLRSQTLDRLFADAATALERGRRDDLRRQAEDALLAELPRLPLAAHPRLAAFWPELTGLRLAAAPLGETWNVHEWGLLVP